MFVLFPQFTNIEFARTNYLCITNKNGKHYASEQKCNDSV